MPHHVIELVTLHQTPSWQNAAGRVDRSACAAVRAAQLWRRIPPEQWQPCRSASRPGTRRPNSRVHREARARIELTADDLTWLHRQTRPFQLLGDYRTEKANAMKRTNRPETGRLYSRTLRVRTGRRTPQVSNPNKGACGDKTLALPPDWSQTLTIERWRLHEKLARHFLICPRCGVKKTKLFLPLAAPAEWADAQRAIAYLHRTAAGLNKPLTDFQLELITRYGLLLPPRRLLCIDCLGIRFGYIHPKKDGSRPLTPADPNTAALLSMSPTQRRAHLRQHIRNLQISRHHKRRVKRLRKAWHVIEQYQAAEHDDAAFLKAAEQLMRFR